jgi:hypothetical protein
LVSFWKRFESGKLRYDLQTGNINQTDPLRRSEFRITKNEAANIIRMSKKTLDYYAMIIRFGLKYGFNFEAYVNSKVGELRNFERNVRRILKI